MECGETLSLINGYLDNELDLVNCLHLERHLRSCPACVQVSNNLQALSGAVKSSDLYYKASPSLRRRVSAAVRVESGARRSALSPLRSWGLAAALGVALTAACVAVFFGVSRRSAADDFLVSEVVASHVRSLQAGHLLDVPSSDQHTVKPWFTGKLDFSPGVRDLSAAGFPLIGGRLDYLSGRAVAALVYQRRQHRINLFVWPVGSGGDSRVSSIERQGYHAIRWTRAGMNYWAVSDLNQSELQDFTARLRE